jgi:hypothetical protein
MAGNPSHSSSFISRGASIMALVLVGAAGQANRIPDLDHPIQRRRGMT